MNSKADSLQDIFGPTSSESNGPDKLGHREGTETTTESTSATKVDDFDEIFGGSNESMAGTSNTPSSGEKPQFGDSGGRSSASAAADVDQPASLGPDDFDNIFGGSSSEPGRITGSDKSRNGEPSVSSIISGGDGEGDATGSADEGQAGTEQGASAAGHTASSDREKAFLDFLYDGERVSVVSGARDAEDAKVPSSYDFTTDSAMPGNGGGSQLNVVSLPEDASRSARAKAPQRPIPADPARALRELIRPEQPAEADVTKDEPDVGSGSGADAADDSKIAEDMVPAAEDVDYVRRLCMATGGFLAAELRPAVWSLLLGLGSTQPEDVAFRKWQETQNQQRSGREGSSSSGSGSGSITSAAAAVQDKIDLHNDSLALARRLCDGSSAATGADDVSAPREVRSASSCIGKDPVALATDIEHVLTFYCTRRSEPYEPVLSALVAPLFFLGIEAEAVSAMLYPLVGALTLFLGRGLTLAVRDLAWSHTHRRLHDLCTYHDPQLVQHLDRCFPGWEMPLPAASVSRAETSARDQEAAALVDDLESSLGPSSISLRRQSAGRPNPSKAFSAEEGEGEDSEAPDDVASGLGSRGSSVSEKQGLIEPSLLVAACSGLGAAVPLERLVLLWDYLLVRRDKHFGFFLLVAALLRRRDGLLAASGSQLRRLLAETLSPEGLASAGLETDEKSPEADSESIMKDNYSKDDGSAGGVHETGDDGEASAGGTGGKAGSTLTSWCMEAESFDLATPESFRQHLSLIGEIAEAEHEAAMRSRGRAEDGGEVSPMKRGTTSAMDAVAVAAIAASAPSKRTQGGGPAAADSASSSTVSSREAGAVGGGGSGSGSAEDASSAKSGSSSSYVKMRSMMKNAGDRIAADFKSLKLARTPSGSRAAPSPEDPAPPSELPLPQLCLAVSAKELVFRVAAGKRPDDSGDEEGETANDFGEEVGLFRQRRPLSFFPVDCRPKEQVEAGRLPTAYHLDPASMDNPEDMAESLLPVFEPLKGKTHLCLVGTGDGYIRARGLVMGDGRPRSWEHTATGLGSLKATRDDYSYVNTCALFFVKRGFPYVSILEGGYAAAHELVMDVLSRGAAMSSTGGKGTAAGGSGSVFTAIVDYNPAACRLSLAKRNAASGASSGTGNAHGGATVPGGVNTPTAPPIWARIGAADSSSHGQASGAEGAEDAAPPRKRQPQARPTNVGDRVTNVFFPPPREKGSSGRPPVAATSSSAGDGARGGAKGGQEGEVVGATAPSPASLFRGGTMFRGMNVNMGMNVNNLFKGTGAARAPTPPSGVAGGALAGGALAGSGSGASDSVDAGEVKRNSVTGTASSSGGQTGGAAKTQSTVDIASKIRVSLGRFSTGGRETRKDREPKGSGASAAGEGAPQESVKKDSSFSSLFRKAQAFKPADMAAAFADLRDGPKSSGTGVRTPSPAAAAAAGKAAPSPSGEPQAKMAQGESGGDDDEADGGGVFVIGDDGSESSETPDSDFEGFDGEHRPPSSGGTRSEADKALALLEHRLSGQVKGGTMVVEEFLKVPGAKIFTVTKHKVTYHDVEAAPADGDPVPDSKDASAPLVEGKANGVGDAATTGKDVDTDELEEKAGGDVAGEEASAVKEEGDTVASAGAEKDDVGTVKESVRVRAVTELERLIFLSRERILVVACPDGPRSPGLVKSNHHLTELLKMTFLRRDPTLVTLHYVAPGAQAELEQTHVPGSENMSSPMKTKRNVYRFAGEDKETFIRIIRGAMLRFQT